MDQRKPRTDLESTLTEEIFESLIYLGIPIWGKLKNNNSKEHNIITSGNYGRNIQTTTPFDELWEIINRKYTEIYLKNNPEMKWKLPNTLL